MNSLLAEEQEHPDSATHTSCWAPPFNPPVILLVLAITIINCVYPHRAMAGVLHQAGSCGAGSLVAVVAHADDDLLFVNPGITDRLDAGWCVTVVHLVGGANDPLSYDYVKLRESGDRAAYAHMAGTANLWTESTVTLNGNGMHMMSLANSSITLVEFRIKGGAVRTGPVPLADLWDVGQSITTWGMQDYDMQPSTYTRDTLVGKRIERAEYLLGYRIDHAGRDLIVREWSSCERILKLTAARRGADSGRIVGTA